MFGKKLKMLAKQRQFTAKSLAEVTGIPTPTIYALYSDKFRPNPDTLNRLAGALKVTVEELQTPTTFVPANDSNMAVEHLTHLYTEALGIINALCDRQRTGINVDKASKIAQEAVKLAVFRHNQLGENLAIDPTFVEFLLAYSK